MKILLIGGTGVLSSAVLAEALECGFKVTILNRGKNKVNIPQVVSHIKTDYWNRESVETALKDKYFDATIDFISRVKKDIEYSIDVLKDKTQHFVFISTACVYDTSIKGIKFENSKKVLSTWSYSYEKWDCECFLEEKSTELNLNYSIIRPCITYDDTRIPYGIMPPNGFHWTWIARILAGKPIIRWDGGTARWNMMRVEDFAVAVVGILNNPKAYNQTFNVCGDVAYSWNDVINCIENIIGKKAILFDTTSKEYASVFPNIKGEISGRALDLIADNSKIKSVVPQFKTNYSLMSGISKTILAYKNNEYQKGIDWNFEINTDKAILELCRRNGINKKLYNLRFIDYLEDSSKGIRKKYWLEVYSSRIDVKIYNLVRKIKNKIFQ